jgi:hypothetical protein
LKPLIWAAAAVAAVACLAALVLPFIFIRVVHGVSFGTQIATYLGTALLLGGFLGCALALRKNQVEKGMCGATILGAAAVALLVTVSLHLYDNELHRPFRRLLAVCLEQKANVATFLRDSPAANFYLARYVRILRDSKDFREFTATTSGKHFVLLTKDVLDRARQRAPHLNQIEQRSKWYLFSVD